MTVWHESVEGSPDDAPLDETQAAVHEAVAAEAARLEAIVEADRERWARHYDLLAPLPAVFTSQEDE